MKGLALKEKLTPECEESSDGSYDLFSNITRDISKSNRHTGSCNTNIFSSGKLCTGNSWTADCETTKLCIY